MGIDYYVCDHCGDTFPDYGPYERCNEDCWRKWCSSRYRACAKKDGYVVNDEEEDEYGEPVKSCSYCRNEAATDVDLLSYLIKKYKLSKKKLEKEYLAEKKKESNEPTT